MANEQKKPTGTDPNRQQQDQRPTGGSSGYQPGGSGQRQDDWSQRGGRNQGNTPGGDQGGMKRPESDTNLDRDTDLDEEDRA